mmetsp:Transcript_14427/g.46164  ORF Transcript_14427/g.46164 Transcript_14427/m.46164 type:complete len:202 (+) Transcript_14427:279-884(+)
MDASATVACAMHSLAARTAPRCTSVEPNSQKERIVPSPVAMDPLPLSHIASAASSHGLHAPMSSAAQTRASRHSPAVRPLLASAARSKVAGRCNSRLSRLAPHQRCHRGPRLHREDHGDEGPPREDPHHHVSQSPRGKKCGYLHMCPRKDQDGHLWKRRGCRCRVACLLAQGLRLPLLKLRIRAVQTVSLGEEFDGAPLEP